MFGCLYLATNYTQRNTMRNNLISLGMSRVGLRPLILVSVCGCLCVFVCMCICVCAYLCREAYKGDLSYNEFHHSSKNYVWNDAIKGLASNAFERSQKINYFCGNLQNFCVCKANQRLPLGWLTKRTQIFYFFNQPNHFLFPLQHC